uniref:Uncharacterized protein n=1 Tax=Anguilla anguilla TaxID=7936 RepID=A0A0E9XL72_ANGAN
MRMRRNSPKISCA